MDLLIYAFSLTYSKYSSTIFIFCLTKKKVVKFLCASCRSATSIKLEISDFDGEGYLEVFFD